jgi:hypothetical protein
MCRVCKGSVTAGREQTGQEVRCKAVDQACLELGLCTLWSAYHGVAQKEDRELGVVLLNHVHMLQYIPDEDVKVRHHHPLPLTLSVANWKGSGEREVRAANGVLRVSLISPFPATLELWILFLPLLQIRKSRHRVIKELSRDHS